MDWQTIVALIIVFACVAYITRVFIYSLMGKSAGGCHSCGSGDGCGSSQKPVQVGLPDQESNL